VVVFVLRRSTFTFAAFAFAPLHAVRWRRVAFAPFGVTSSITVPSLTVLRMLRANVGLVTVHNAMSNTSVIPVLVPVGLISPR